MLVSRERYEEALQREAKLEAKNEALMNKIMDLVEQIASFTVPEKTEANREFKPSFELPAVVKEAISQRTPKGSATEGMLRKFAERRLSEKVGEIEPEDVAKEILAGSDAFDEEGW